MYSTLTHFTSPGYWPLYSGLSLQIRETADKNFSLLKSNPRHPSLHLKKIGDLWSVRAGLRYRAVGMDAPGEEMAILWFWIGSHSEYNHFIKGR